MIFFGIALRNPFTQLYRLIWEKTIPVTKNTSIELCVYRTNTIIGFGFNITGFKQDHRGGGFDLELLGFTFDFNFYDHRHYNEIKTK